MCLYLLLQHPSLLVFSLIVSPLPHLAFPVSDERVEAEKLQDAAAAAHEPSRSTNGGANHRDFSGESRFDQIRASFQSFKEKSCLKSPSKEKASNSTFRVSLADFITRVRICVATINCFSPKTAQ